MVVREWGGMDGLMEGWSKGWMKRERRRTMRVDCRFVQYYGLSDEQKVNLVGFQPSQRVSYFDLWEEAGAK